MYMQKHEHCVLEWSNIRPETWNLFKGGILELIHDGVVTRSEIKKVDADGHHITFVFAWSQTRDCSVPSQSPEAWKYHEPRPLKIWTGPLSTEEEGDGSDSEDQCRVSLPILLADNRIFFESCGREFETGRSLVHEVRLFPKGCLNHPPPPQLV